MTRRLALLITGLALFDLACKPRTSTPESKLPAGNASTSPTGSDEDLSSRGAVRARESEKGASALDDRWLTVTVLTRGLDRNWWAMVAGGKLRSGEVLMAEIDLREPAHIYIINVDRSGIPVLLYPDPALDEDVLLAEGKHELPPTRSSHPHITLDARPGTEHLFFIATRAPVQDVDRGLGQLIEELRRGEKPVLVRELMPPRHPAPVADATDPTKSPRKASTAAPRRSRKEIEQALFAANVGAVPELRERGGYRSRTEGAGIDAKADANGVVVVPFRFEHI